MSCNYHLTSDQRWPANSNYFVLDAVPSNARTMYNERNKLTLKKFEFTCELGRGLVMTFIQKCQSLVGFPDKLFEK